MTVTAKEEREIVAECKELADGGENMSEALTPTADSDVVTAENAPTSALQGEDVKKIVDACLDSRLSPLIEVHRAASEKMSHMAANVEKIGNIYDLMTEWRNKSTLLLTKHIEMYERLKALSDFCHENIRVGDGQISFEKSLLTRVDNAVRIALRTLGSFAVLPIWPERNEAFDEALHQIVSETDIMKDDDIPGTIAECLKMGVIRDGVVAKAAEVVVFKAKSAQQAEPKV